MGGGRDFEGPQGSIYMYVYMHMHMHVCEVQLAGFSDFRTAGIE